LGESLLAAAVAGSDHPVIELVARAEGVSHSFLHRQIASGRIVVMQRQGNSPVGIGEGLRTKINANIGSSSGVFDLDAEVKKARTAEEFGADTISDLSMGGPIDLIRKRILEETKIPLTTVPIYQTVVEKRSFADLTEADLIRMIGKHVDEGISSLVVHADFTFEMLQSLRERKRIMGMEMNAGLARRANELGVQVIIEGMGGHVSPDKISDYVAIYKRKTDRRPLFVAGPLPIDIGVGYDHISGCAGGALAAGSGADYLCYITPSEHLALPNAAQVREGVVAFRIAAHIGDTLKYGPRAEDMKLAMCRKARDWEGQFRFAIDSSRARELCDKDESGSCTMCGKYCVKPLDSTIRSAMERIYHSIKQSP